MEKPEISCWADFSDDETSDTEELTPSMEPNKKMLIDSISVSQQSIFHMKIENLPYNIIRNEEIYCFFNISDTEATIRMQYKGKKFIGFALAIAKSVEAATKIAMKYGTNLNGRPILVYYKPNESAQWIPQKRSLLNTSISRQIMSLVSPKANAQKSVERKSMSIIVSPKANMQKSGERKSMSSLIGPNAGIHRNLDRSIAVQSEKESSEKAGSEAIARDSAIIRALPKETKLNNAEPRVRFTFK